jgi:hypothetical protein
MVAPSDVTVATMASAMPAAIIAYSMAVAPEAPRQKRIKDVFIALPILRPLVSAYFYKRPAYERFDA